MTNDLVERARKFALEKHGAQIYSSKFPYLTHLEMVYATLVEFECKDEILLAAAYLHDTIEDTRVSYQDLKNEFSEEIAELVYCVSDELGRNRKERHIKTYPKIAQNSKAITLKLADRISNVSFSLGNGDKSDMYHKEYAGFRAALYNGQNMPMWDKLDQLSNFNS